MAAFSIIGLLIILIILAIPAGIIYGIVALVRRSGTPSIGLTPRSAESLPGAAERIFTYVLSFAGFMAVLFGLSTLLALAFIPIIPDVSTLISADDVRVRASYSLAALIVGAPLWLGLWRHAQKRVAKNPAERNAVERRLHLGAIFATAAIVALFGAQEALSALISLVGNGDRSPLIRDAVTGGSLFVVYSAAWLGYPRFGDGGPDGQWRGSSARAEDWAHDLATYAVTGVALVFLLLGLGNIMHELLRQLQGAGSLLNTTNSWSAWSGPVASILVGGAAWWVLQAYDTRRGQARIFRVVYLYGVLLFVVPLAVYNGSSLLYELIRRAFGYNLHAGNWDFVADVLPWLVVGAAFWLYHWILVRGQAQLQPAIVNHVRAGVIPYPRRLAFAVFTAVGTVMAAVGAAMAIWIGIDSALSTHGALAGGVWWRDELSASITLLVVGAALWLPAWSLLQRAAAQDAAVERDTTERRWLLSGLSLGGALVALGFAIALLYQILRAVLGQTDANTLSNALHYGSTAIVALAVAAYYGTILRAALRQRATTPAITRNRLAVLLAPDSETALAEILEGGAYQVEVIGYIAREESGRISNLQTLRAALALLGTSGHSDQALLVLGPSGGCLYPYTRHVPGTDAAQASVRAVQPGTPIRAT
jgi:hypothetical protein